MQVPRAILRVLLLALLSAALSCKGDGGAPLTVGTNIWIGYQPLVIACDLGVIPARDARVVEFSSNTESLRAFRSGATVAAALTLDEVLLLLQDGFKPRVVLVFDESRGGDALIARSSFTGVPELAGRRIGVEDTALGAFMLTRALESAQLTIEDVTIVRLPVDEHERAFLDGRVDALVTFEPVRTRLVKAGARVLFDTRSLPHEVVDVLVVRDDVLAHHPKQVEAILRGWFALLPRFREDTNLVSRIGRNVWLIPDEVRAAMAGLAFPDWAQNLALLDGDHPELGAAVERLQAMMLQRRLLRHPVDASSLLAPGSLVRVRP